MSAAARERRKQRRGFNRRCRGNKGTDFQVQNWIYIAIHAFPSSYRKQHTMDLWCHSGKEMYLLTLLKNETNSVVLSKSKGRNHVFHLQVKANIETVDLDGMKTITQLISSVSLPQFGGQQMKIQYNIANV